jgi:hypothetical protein
MSSVRTPFLYGTSGFEGTPNNIIIIRISHRDRAVTDGIPSAALGSDALCGVGQ